MSSTGLTRAFTVNSSQVIEILDKRSKENHPDLAFKAMNSLILRFFNFTNFTESYVGQTRMEDRLLSVFQ